MSETDFYNKLISFNKKVSSNKTKYLEVKKKLNSVTTKDDLDAWPRKLTNNFKFKNCLFVGTSLVKNSNKEKYVDSG